MNTDFIDFVFRELGEFFDAPCNYSYNKHDVDLFMLDHAAEWCDEHCGQKNHTAGECWEQYFTILYKGE